MAFGLEFDFSSAAVMMSTKFQWKPQKVRLIKIFEASVITLKWKLFTNGKTHNEVKVKSQRKVSLGKLAVCLQV